MNIFEKHLLIQKVLFVPKEQKNTFGGYNYRTTEDILAAVKEPLAENKCTLYLSNEVVQVGDRYYVQATATLVDLESGEKMEVKAQAREEETKKGMDSSQITGAATSYARKYALAGLFCIDNEKDSDATNRHEDKQLSKDELVKDAENRSRLIKYINSKQEAEKAMKFVLDRYKKEAIGKLTEEEVSDCVKFFELKGENI